MTTMTTAIPGALGSTSHAAAATSATAPATSRTARDHSAGIGRLLTAIALVGGTVLAGIGFTGSYTALRDLGFTHGLGDFSYAFPIGVDAGIVVLLALDLHLIRKGTPWPVLRLLAHGFTAATIAFNAAAAKGPIAADPIGAAMHAVIPIMFVAAVEAARRLIIQAARIEAGQESVGVPLHRWILAPFASWRLYRRMRLWNAPSYAQMVALEKERTVYKTMLEREYGSIRRAPSEARLPLTMAPYGLSVEEALALPAQAKEAEELRKERAADAEQLRKERAADAAQEAELRAARRAADAEIARAEHRGRIEAARCASEVEARAREAEARAREVAAQEAAKTRAQAEESAAAAEARARAAEVEARAAEVEARAREARARAAEVARHEAEEERARQAAEAGMAEARARAAEAERAASEAEARAAEARLQEREIERRAAEVEDELRLSPRERTVRRVARLAIAETGGDAMQLPLGRIQEVVGGAESTASGYRTQAAALLRTGYRP